VCGPIERDDGQTLKELEKVFSQVLVYNIPNGIYIALFGDRCLELTNKYYNKKKCIYS
jgi:hypothetical protein